GLLTMGIATRVVVSHGRHPMRLEAVLLRAWQVAALLVAALTRGAAEYASGAAREGLLGTAGLLWSAAWIAWAWAALPRIRYVAPAQQVVHIQSPASSSR